MQYLQASSDALPDTDREHSHKEEAVPRQRSSLLHGIVNQFLIPSGGCAHRGASQCRLTATVCYSVNLHEGKGEKTSHNKLAASNVLFAISVEPNNSAIKNSLG